MTELKANVIVVGGGIAGIQSALDLADSDLKVVIVDSYPSLGGRMAQLDKTFPTNDCSMCIMAPKLVAAGRHPNIKLLTYSEIEGISGRPGDFTVRVRKKARHIVEDKCKGCGECTMVCPVRYKIVVNERPPAPPPVRDREAIDAMIKRQSHHRSSLLPVMLEVNKRYRYLPRDVIEYLSYVMDVPVTHIVRLATFYKAFSLEERGRYHIKVCKGTACYVRGAESLLDRITTVMTGAEKGTFSLEVVNCLGACAMGPIMVVNDDYHGNLTHAKAEKVLTELMGGAKA